MALPTKAAVPGWQWATEDGTGHTGPWASTLLPGISRVMVRETALTKSYCWLSRGRWAVEEGGLRWPTRQGWQMERCSLAPPALTKEAEVGLPSPASFCACYTVVVLLQQGDAMGSTSLGPHSVWKQTSWVHWNGDKSTDQTRLSSQPVPGQGTCMWPRAFL